MKYLTALILTLFLAQTAEAAMYYSYEKKQAQYTTYELLHPDYEQMPEDSARIAELCTIDGVTYVSVPDSIILPGQSEQIQATLKEVTLMPELITKIRQVSPHVKLMEKRVAEDADIRFSKQDEATLGFLSEFVTLSAACAAYIVKCRKWQTLEGKKL